LHFQKKWEEKARNSVNSDSVMYVQSPSTAPYLQDCRKGSSQENFEGNTIMSAVITL
jgi:hypothetical protein